ncbi:MAG: protein kinase [Pirellulaceae bacterium]
MRAAVHHAHQKGVIHRDIKPSNVMVTLYDDKPVAKVIDFGIAKAIGQSLTDKTIYTRFFSPMIGTPLYMSPEQAEMSGTDAEHTQRYLFARRVACCLPARPRLIVTVLNPWDWMRCVESFAKRNHCGQTSDSRRSEPK